MREFRRRFTLWMWIWPHIFDRTEKQQCFRVFWHYDNFDGRETFIDAFLLLLRRLVIPWIRTSISTSVYQYSSIQTSWPMSRVVCRTSYVVCRISYVYFSFHPFQPVIFLVKSAKFLHSEALSASFKIVLSPQSTRVHAGPPSWNIRNNYPKRTTAGNPSVNR